MAQGRVSTRALRPQDCEQAVLKASLRLHPVAIWPKRDGEFMWAGYAGTYFWIDPEEELVGVLMTQAPSPARAYYRRHMKQLVYQAIVE
jgi:CubicO group peptidase (beta-lactamase class C family)